MKTRIQTNGRIAWVMLLAVVVSASSAPAITVDGFDSGTNFNLGTSEFFEAPSFYNQTAFWTESAVSGVLGGTRDIFLEWTSGNSGGTGTASVNTSNSYLNFSNSAGVRSLLTLTYDADGAGLTGADRDFTDAGAANAVLIGLLYSDQDAEITVTVTDGSGGKMELARTTSSNTSPHVLGFEFTDFTAVPTFSAVTWTDITSVVYEIDAVTSGDYKITLLRSGAIPEPFTLVATFIGFAAAGRYIRKRRRGFA